MMRIRFLNQDYLYTGDSLEEGGAITTEELFRNGECSFAHLFEDGKIKRFQKQIGTRADIEIIDSNVAVKINARRFITGMLDSPTWYRP